MKLHIELTDSSKKWCFFFFTYRPPKQNSILLFEGMSSSLSHFVNEHDNYSVARDLSINMLDPKCDGGNHFSDLKDTYNLSNLVKSATCFKSSKSTLLDVLLTNKPKRFQNTLVCETGLSDWHKLVATIFRSTFIKLPPKVVNYGSYKKFDENKFCQDLDQILIQRDSCKADDPYEKLTNIYDTEKHASLKSKIIRGNHPHEKTTLQNNGKIQTLK